MRLFCLRLLFRLFSPNFFYTLLTLAHSLVENEKFSLRAWNFFFSHNRKKQRWNAEKPPKKRRAETMACWLTWHGQERRGKSVAEKRWVVRWKIRGSYAADRQHLSPLRKCRLRIRMRLRPTNRRLTFPWRRFSRKMLLAWRGVRKTWWAWGGGRTLRWPCVSYFVTAFKCIFMPQI